MRTTKKILAIVLCTLMLCGLVLIDTVDRRPYTFEAFAEQDEPLAEVEEPAEIEEPVDIEEPIEPEQPTEPEKPAETEQPTEPEKPTETEQPTEPEKPAETEQPTEPEKPTETEEPTETEKPIETEEPAEPQKPTEVGEGNHFVTGSVEIEWLTHVSLYPYDSVRIDVVATRGDGQLVRVANDVILTAGNHWKAVFNIPSGYFVEKDDTKAYHEYVGYALDITFPADGIQYSICVNGTAFVISVRMADNTDDPLEEEMSDAAVDEVSKVAMLAEGDGIEAAEDNQSVPETWPKAVFYNWNDDVTPLYEVAVEQGTYAAYEGETPTREGYDFVGWYPDPALSPISRDTQFVAQFRSSQEKLYLLTVYYAYENGTEVARPYVGTFAYGDSYEVVSPTIQGYMPDQAIVSGVVDGYSDGVTVVHVTYLPGDTNYVVRHYQQRLGMPAGGAGEQDLSNYDLVSEEAKTGTTESTVKVEPKVYAGFTPLQGQKLEHQISADGGTVFNIFYTRDTYVIYFRTQGGSYVDPIVAEYGAVITAEVKASKITERAGYTFTGWDKAIPDAMPVDGDTITAAWQPKGNISYSLVYWLENVAGDGYEYYDMRQRTGTAGATITLSAADKIAIDYFTYGRFQEGMTIAGDGSTMVNVYYTRNSYTVIFAWGDNCPTGTRIVLGGKTVATSPGTPYQFTAKYQEDISSLWPAGADIVIPISASREFNGWNNYYAMGRHIPKVMSMGSSVCDPSGTLTVYGDWYDKTMVEHTLHYMLECLAGETGTSYTYGGTTRQYDDSPLHFLVMMTSTGSTWSTYKSIAGFTAQNIVNPSGPHVYFYYTRNSYQLTFFNYNAENRSYTIQYEAPIMDKEYTPTHPTGLDPAWTFEGWYTNQECFPESRFDWDGAMMPSRNLTLYANWVPPVYEVEFTYTDEDGEEYLFETQWISSGGHATRPDTSPVLAGYVFRGWSLRGSNVMFQFDSQPIVRSTELVANWTVSGDIEYTVNYWLVDGDWAPDDPTGGVRMDISPNPKTVSGQNTSSTVYETAPAVAGFMPDHTSKSIALKGNSQENVIDFFYKAYEMLGYTVYYIDGDGNTLLEPKVVDDETRTAVIEYAPFIPGYTSTTVQQRITLTLDASANVITFRYMANPLAEYSVEYYYMDPETGRYGDDPDERKILAGPTGLKVTAEDKPMPGYELDRANSQTWGYIAESDGLVLRMLYRRSEVEWTVFHYRYGTTEELAPTETGMMKFGLIKTASPVEIDGYVFAESDPADMRIVIQSDPSLNVIIVYYRPDGGVSIGKTANRKLVTVGEVIKYTVTVTNTSAEKMTDVVADDPFMDGAWTIGTLQPGETRAQTYTYTVTQADVDVGYVYNTVTATGASENGDLEEGFADHTIPVVSEKPSITILVLTQAIVYGEASDDAVKKTWKLYTSGLPDGMTLEYGRDYTIKVADDPSGLPDLSAGTHYNCTTFEPTDYLIDLLDEYELLLVPGSLIVNTKFAIAYVGDFTKMYDGQPLGYKTTQLPESPPVFIDPSQLLSGHTIYGATVGNSSFVNVGDYRGQVEMTQIIIHDAQGNDVTSNYSVGTLKGDLKITPEPAKLTVNDAEITYGDPEPTYGAHVEFSGIGQGGSLNYTLKRAPGTDVGTYRISANLGSNPNYSITVVDGTLTIKPRTVTLTVNNVSKDYGAPDPDFTVRVTHGAIVEGDSLDYTIERVEGEAPGAYEVNIILGDNPNYAITVEPGFMTIEQKPEVKVSLASQSYVYGEIRDEYWWILGVWRKEITGLPNGMTLSYPGDYTISIEQDPDGLVDRSVGTYTVSFVPTDALLEKLEAYSLVLEPGTLTVTKKTAAVYPYDVEKMYNRKPLGFHTTTQPSTPFVYISPSQMVSGHIIYSATIGNDSIVNVGEYPGMMLLTDLVIHDADGNDVTSNYDLSITPGKLTITPQPVKITIDDVEITYGDEEPTYTATVSYQGDGQGEPVVYTLEREQGIDVGIYEITANLGENPNYDITVENGTLTIKPKGNDGKEPGEGDPDDFYGTITIDPQTKLYGEDDPEFTYTCSFEGLEYDDELSFTLVRDPGEDIGTYVITVQWDDTFPTMNYDLSAVRIEENYLTIDGVLEWGEPEAGGMDLHFGTQRLPLDAIDYPSTDGSHTLRISDSRIDANGWYILAGMGMFEGDDGSSFKGEITLTNAMTENSGVSIPGSVRVVSGGGTVPVMTATDALGSGVFDVTWNGDDVMLYLDDEEVSKVQPTEYQAQITWTIVNTQ